MGSSNADITRTTLYRTVPRLATGVEVQRKPVIAAGEFVWSDVLITTGYPEGMPHSRLVAQLVSLVDGHRSVAERKRGPKKGTDLFFRHSAYQPMMS